MKILQINKFYYPRGGAERYMFNLSHLLEEHGHTIIPFAMQHPKNIPTPWSEFFVSPVETGDPKVSESGLKTARRVLWSNEAAEKLEQLIEKTKPDIAHLHLIYHHLSPSILPVLKRHHIPMVMTLHDYKLICPNYKLYTKGSPCERCRGHKFYNATTNKCLKDSYLASGLASMEAYLHHARGVYEKNIDLMIAPSQFVRDTFVRFGENGLKIRVLPHFLPELPKQERGTGEEPVILYVGRLAEEKGIDKFLESLYNIPSPWKVVIAGTGPLADALQERVQTLLAAPPIEFVDYQDGEALASWYRRAGIVVVPSVFYEPFGLVVLEAFGYGKPVIVSDRGALPELVDHETTGLIVPADNRDAWHDALIRLINDERLRHMMGKNGRKAVEILYTSEGHYTKLMEWYEEFIKKSQITNHKSQTNFNRQQTNV